MSHTDDGLLHAYLDGELPAAEVARLREHVAACADCRARLDLARETRSRAHAILRMADPPGIVAPDFATLASNNRTWASPVRSPARARLFLLPWAASLLLALGAGWFAQELLRGSRGEPSRVAVADRDVGAAGSAVNAAAEAESGGPLAASADRQAAEAMSDDGQTAPMPPAAPAADGVDVDGGGADALAGVGLGAGEARRGETTVAQSAATAGSPGGIAGDRGADEAGAIRARAPQASPPPTISREMAQRVPANAAPLDRVGNASMPAPPPAPMIQAEVDTEGWPREWVGIDRAAAVKVLGEELVIVPGLRVEAFQVGNGTGVAIRVLQLLPGGETLEVLQRRGASPTAEEALFEQATEPASAAFSTAKERAPRRGILEISVRADVPADSLRRLTESVR